MHNSRTIEIEIEIEKEIATRDLYYLAVWKVTCKAFLSGGKKTFFALTNIHYQYNGKNYAIYILCPTWVFERMGNFNEEKLDKKVVRLTHMTIPIIEALKYHKDMILLGVKLCGILYKTQD